MAIRDRGKMKWQGAFFMPEHTKLLGDLRTEYYRTNKPQLDDYQYDEIDERITEAIAENLPIKVSVWKDGFTTDIVGKMHAVDPLKMRLCLENEQGEYEYIRFEEIINVVMND